MLFLTPQHKTTGTKQNKTKQKDKLERCNRNLEIHGFLLYIFMDSLYHLCFVYTPSYGVLFLNLVWRTKKKTREKQFFSSWLLNLRLPCLIKMDLVNENFDAIVLGTGFVQSLLAAFVFFFSFLVCSLSPF